MTCKACRKRISKYHVHLEIMDTVYVEAYPRLGYWGQYDPPGFLCAIHQVVGRNNDGKVNYDGSLLRKILPAQKPQRKRKS